ncbi:MAG: hypothetical protein R3279_12550 [Putridiphycobacter sp.]|nr:hypothetical protein [Putridiphycobacter sp.]
MKIKRSFLLLILMVLSVFTYAYPHQFNVDIRQADGDLNNDGIADRVLIKMDTISKSRPLCLQIFFAQPNGQYKLKVSTTNLIAAQYLRNKNGKNSGYTIPNIEIEGGSLHLETYFKGISVHSFKYLKRSFRLVSYSNIFWDGKQTTIETNLDFIRGLKTERTHQLGSQNNDDQVETDFFIRRSPKIQHYNTAQFEP